MVLKFWEMQGEKRVELRGRLEGTKLRFTESKWIQEERRSLSMWTTAEEAKP